MKLFFTGLILVAFASGFTQTRFASEYEVLNADNYPSSISDRHLADLNGDRKLDILIANPDAPHLTWYENMGEGHSWERHIISLPDTGFYNIEVSDIDQDGYTDILVLDRYNHHIGSFINDNGEGFSGYTILHEYSFDMFYEDLNSFHMADMDGNGLPDLVMKLLLGYDSYWLANDGEGVFPVRPKRFIQPEDTARLHQLIDIDLDGDLDVLYMRDSSISMVLNDGVGNFQMETIPIPDEILPFILSLEEFTFLHFDNDSMIDMMYANASIFSSFSYTYWFELSNNVWTLQSTFNNHFFTDFYRADIDSDGYDEVISGSCIWEVRDSPFLQDCYCINTDSEIIGDINGDGIEDFLFSYGDQLYWQENHQPDFSQHYISAGRYYSNLFEIADLNGDAYPDLVIIDPQKHLKWYKNVGENQFEDPADLAINRNVSDFRLSDVNMDGYTDIVLHVSSLCSDQHTEVFTQDASGNFTYANSLPELSLISKVLDVDGDGDPDILGKRRLSDNGDFWFINDGMGQFTLGDATNLMLHSPVFKDVNGDGYIDVFTTKPYVIGGPRSNLYLNDGYGNFEDEWQIPLPDYNYRLIDYSDINGDMKSDLLFNTGSGYLLSWSSIDGSGTLLNQEYFSYGEGHRKKIEVHDIDMDGDQDVILHYYNESYENEKIGWIENIGLGKFRDREVITNLDNSRFNQFKFLDFDTDGDLDLFTRTVSSASIYFQENLQDELNPVQPPILVNLAPNPATEQLGVYIQSIVEYPLQASLYSYNGSLVKQLDNVQTAAILINIQDLQSGCYYIKLSNQEETNLGTYPFIILP